MKHKEKHLVLRVSIAIFGILVTLIGLAMVVLPGPAFVFIPFGLSILALEFNFAFKLLIKAETTAQKSINKIKKKKLGKTASSQKS